MQRYSPGSPISIDTENLSNGPCVQCEWNAFSGKLRIKLLNVKDLTRLSVEFSNRPNDLDIDLLVRKAFNLWIYGVAYTMQQHLLLLKERHALSKDQAAQALLQVKYCADSTASDKQDTSPTSNVSRTPRKSTSCAGIGDRIGKRRRERQKRSCRN